ncbi:MAG TPA: response regulator transcription factor [Kiritimatiellia bacterium]|nr:response regulator transcription factor [Kiritimatiellia bacterium]HNS79956.1 response regulator transcription factor [Kiritimatiellia bacterium]HPA78703.1 response regulator transcription factor [Kiritimatiellia bacterium]HQQ04340.1 response regulator transcription factor [Kiritimatiellia bacterium]
MNKQPAAPNRLRILIVEDHPILCRGLRDILSEEFPDAVFGEADESRSALQAFRRQPWDVVLLDINIPGRDGLSLLDDVRRIRPAARVLVVSAYPEEEFAVRALKLGAAGYLGKNEAPEKLVEAVNKILGGGTYVNAILAEKLVTVLTASSDARLPHETLSARELQVLRLIADGKTAKKIAEELSLSEKTIATYRARIAEKTGLSTNVQLTRYAFQHNLTG